MAEVSIKKYLPRSLLGRSLMILIMPVLLIQLITAVVFFDRHWGTMTRRLAFSVSGVEAWQRVNVVLRDIAGRTVAQTVWRGSHSDWQLEHLPRGVYMYELRTDDGRRAVGKVVKT